ncbi:DUF4229 domain-containing protein [Ruania halotolerans]|uniref:DUF4229 domain-containing protein n=1 Tax=Ruania halotolerans TaxID=2897773 RepID=UPI001E60163C|nr:DUF4229 domain-containing protein [Ruania halotolerans]UFU05821.1 DUF4229 domain-containing protein [Ruania halotolerans]
MPVLAYSVLRILLIVVAGFGLYLAGMRGVLLVAGAVLIGAGLSYVLLEKFRRASAAWLQARGGGRPSRFAAALGSDAREEDEIIARPGDEPPAAAPPARTSDEQHDPEPKAER